MYVCMYVYVYMFVFALIDRSTDGRVDRLMSKER